jgi:hypothetical protein
LISFFIPSSPGFIAKVACLKMCLSANNHSWKENVPEVLHSSIEIELMGHLVTGTNGTFGAAV